MYEKCYDYDHKDDYYYYYYCKALLGSLTSTLVWFILFAISLLGESPHILPQP